ncbi:MAG TPA: substrate-binding domain-containing protein [Treponema sp.]|nr:substrate-binding domain-containing protein [Treponema sp.]
MIYKKKIKNVMSVLHICSLVVLFFCITSCTSSERRISLFLYTDTDPYIMLYTEEILANAGTDLRVERYFARNSQTIQNEQIERTINRKTDLMIVNPVDRLGMYPVIERLRQEKIPVIFINREPLARDLDRWNQIWYVGARADQSGQLQASLVATLFGPATRLGPLDRNGDGKIQTVLLKGEQGHQDAEIRTEQVTKSLASAGYDIQLLTTEVANWNEEQAFQKMEGVISRWLPQIELVISNNDAMALGAIKALRAAGKFVDDSGDGKIGCTDASWIPIVGIDGIRDAQVMIDRGYLAGTVYNDYRSQARALMRLARAVLGFSSENITDSKYVWIDYTTIRPE